MKTILVTVLFTICLISPFITSCNEDTRKTELKEIYTGILRNVDEVENDIRPSIKYITLTFDNFKTTVTVFKSQQYWHLGENYTLYKEVNTGLNWKNEPFEIDTGYHVIVQTK